MGFLAGKKILVVGLASNRSIAWGIANAMRREGAELALTYQNDRLRKRIDEMAARLDVSITLPCDVSSDEEIRGLFSALGQQWDGLDGIVHSVAYAPREELEGDYVDTATREGFRTAQEISAYSFVALAREGRAMMRGRKAALLTLSYLGGQRVIPNYNIMGPAKASLEANVRYMARSLGPEGTRVNAISAGPIRTLAAAGIANFRLFLDYVESNSPLRRNVSTDEVGNVAAFLCSDLASAVTGEVMFVDCGFNVTAMAEPKSG